MDELTQLKHRVMALEEQTRKTTKVLLALNNAYNTYKSTGRPWISSELEKAWKECLQVFPE